MIYNHQEKTELYLSQKNLTHLLEPSVKPLVFFADCVAVWSSQGLGGEDWARRADWTNNMGYRRTDQSLPPGLAEIHNRKYRLRSSYSWILLKKSFFKNAPSNKCKPHKWFLILNIFSPHVLEYLECASFFNVFPLIWIPESYSILPLELRIGVMKA